MRKVTLAILSLCVAAALVVVSPPLAAPVKETGGVPMQDPVKEPAVPRKSAPAFVAGYGSFSEYRPVGELRLWTFLMKDSALGRLISTVERKVDVNGADGYAVNEKLKLDFRPIGIGSDLTVNIDGDHYVAESGSYLGDDYKIVTSGQESRLKLERDGDRVTGYTSGGGRKVKTDLAVPAGEFAIDNYLVDQFEAYFAMHGIVAGDSINDTIFVPQDHSFAPILGEVRSFGRQELYKGEFDSVFVVRLSQPVPQELFFNRRLQLRKVNNWSQDIRVYLDVVRQQEPEQMPAKHPVTISRLVHLIPNYIVYFIIGLLSMVFFAARSLRRKYAWLGLLAGGVSFVFVWLVQLPVQEWVSTLAAAGGVGPSPSVGWALLIVLPAGLIQEAVKLGGVVSFSVWGGVKRSGVVALGTAIGAGLGIVEACYLDTIVPEPHLFSWTLLERSFMIVFHVITGTLLGWAWRRRGRTVVQMFVVVAALNVVLRLLPIMVQAKAFTAQVMYLVLAAVVILLLLVGVILLKRPDTTPHGQ